MGERTLVVDHLKFSYEGLFNLSELYNLIGGWFYEKGYDWYEKINQEMITPDGKQVRIVLEPWKSASDFYKIILSIKLHATDVKEVEIEHEGQTLRLNQGLIHMTYDGYVVSDRGGQWSGKKSKIFHWFVMILAQKYFFRNHFAKFEDWIKNDVDEIQNKIKTYLNTFKYSMQT